MLLKQAYQSSQTSAAILETGEETGKAQNTPQQMIEGNFVNFENLKTRRVSRLS
jgi:hypothetical protein